jgi:hypothetical protein
VSTSKIKIRKADTNVPEIRIVDRHHRETVFSGTRVAGPVTTINRDNPMPRWLSLVLYRLDSGSWLLHRIGMSLVYHCADTSCHTAAGQPSGSPATVDDLPDGAQECPKCRPPSPFDLGDDEQVRFEFPRHTIDRCDTPARVIEKLTTMNPRGGDRSVMISDPVRELLAQAEEHDGAFADLPRIVEHIT